jgi:hypothetical protein
VAIQESNLTTGTFLMELVHRALIEYANDASRLVQSAASREETDYRTLRSLLRENDKSQSARLCEATFNGRALVYELRRQRWVSG